ncbi:MAG TPA: TetR/AcrR family transcriptional regulator [Candidatus Lustribacter sp.]
MTRHSLSSADLPAGIGLRERSKREKRRRIQYAAEAVFAEKGYAGATTREIAARAEVGAGTIFLYARDKHDLLMMIVNDALDELIERALSTLPAGASLLDQLVHVFALRFDFWMRDLDISRHAISEAYPSLTRPRDGHAEVERFHERRTRTIGALAAIVAAQQRDGAVDPLLDCELAAHLVFDVYIGENRKWLSGDRPTAAEGVATLRRVLELAIRGFIVLTPPPSTENGKR